MVVADEAQRPAALASVQSLRQAGLKIDYPFSAAKIGKQFQAAEEKKARFAVIVGEEYPTVVIKNLIDRSQSEVPAESLVAELQRLLAEPEVGPLLA